jgi:hypothetical protein
MPRGVSLSFDMRNEKVKVSEEKALTHKLGFMPFFLTQALCETMHFELV